MAGLILACAASAPPPVHALSNTVNARRPRSLISMWLSANCCATWTPLSHPVELPALTWRTSSRNGLPIPKNSYVLVRTSELPITDLHAPSGSPPTTRPSLAPSHMGQARRSWPDSGSQPPRPCTHRPTRQQPGSSCHQQLFGKRPQETHGSGEVLPIPRMPVECSGSTNSTPQTGRASGRERV